MFIITTHLEEYTLLRILKGEQTCTTQNITNSIKPISKILVILYKKAITGKYQRSIPVYAKFL